MSKKDKNSRRYPRKKIFADLIIRTRRKKVVGVAYNISLGGLNFVTETALKTGDTYTVEMTITNNEVYSMKGKIVFDQIVDEEIWKYGFEFTTPLFNQEFSLIIELFGFL